MDFRKDRPPRGFQRLSSGVRVELRSAGPPPPRGRRRLEHLVAELARMQGWLTATIDDLGGSGQPPDETAEPHRPAPAPDGGPGNRGE